MLGRAWSIRTHFLLFVAILVVPLAGLSCYLVFEVAAKDRERVEQRMVQIAAGVAADVDRELQRRITILQTLATSPSLARAEFAEFHAQASAALRQDGTGISLIAPQSLQQILNTYVPFGTGLPTYGAPETARRALESRQPQVSDFFTGRVTRRPAFDIIIPVVKDGEVQYLLAMGLEPMVLQRLVGSQNLPPEWIIGVADRKGIILARSLDQDRFIGTALSPVLSTQHPGTASRAIILDGAATLRATERSQLSDWQIAVNFPLAAAETTLRTNLMLLGAWGAIALLLTAASATWFARVVARPIQAASQAATGLADGRAITPFRSGVAEANTLVTALHHASLDLGKAREQQRMLLDELNHRVRNLLSVIIAMTMRTLSSSRLQESRDLLISRFHSIGRAHDLLTANDWEGVAMASFVETELNPFAGRVRARGPDIVLSPGAAQAITMVLHELVTNAAKYGALSEPGGQVDLTWSVLRDREPRLRLRWQESGGPVVKPPTRKGFGTTLLEGALSNAVARIAYDRDGLVYELETPVVGVVAPSSPLDGPVREVMRVEAIAPQTEASSA
jgi:two-component sensor histidine kinase